MRSPCCNARISHARADGVDAGYCDSCGDPVIRRNPRTGVIEWLDGHSIWTEGNLRPAAQEAS